MKKLLSGDSVALSRQDVTDERYTKRVNILYQIALKYRRPTFWTDPDWRYKSIEFKNKNIHFCSIDGTMQTASIMTGSIRQITFEEFLAKIIGLDIDGKRTIKLNNDYTAIVTKDNSVKVGCEDFDIDVFRQVIKAHDELTNK